MIELFFNSNQKVSISYNGWYVSCWREIFLLLLSLIKAMEAFVVDKIYLLVTAYIKPPVYYISETIQSNAVLSVHLCTI